MDYDTRQTDASEGRALGRHVSLPIPTELHSSRNHYVVFVMTGMAQI